ncbi:MAG: hypothetical protein QN163_04940 [Armatimonadota bacterium]|nr:hypothetical protein [Armatimonadota bacterium]MDR5696086.1 hypothetical protein [Armatimonadota bacterium]
MGGRFAVVLGAVLLLGPLVDPHAHDPYHTHWYLADVSRVPGRHLSVGHVVGLRASLRHPAAHATDVVWIRGADLLNPLVLHAAAFLSAVAVKFLLFRPEPTLRAPTEYGLVRALADPEPEVPPPRTG